MGPVRTAVVVGGGVSGAAIARCLAEANVKTTLFEKAQQLCSGATWHAAGLVTRFGGSPKLKKLHVKAVDMMTAMHEAHGGVDMHISGSIRLIEKDNADRFAEAKHHVAMAALYDNPAYPTRLMAADEIQALHPLLDVSSVDCGVWTPADGDVDPTRLTNCIAAIAKKAGAEFRLNTAVTALRRDAEGFEVTTEDGASHRADIVVNCAGLWTRELAKMLGIRVSAVVIEHQYVISEGLEAIKARKAQGLPRLPVLRDLKGSSYIRQEGQGLLIGPYEEDCRVTDWEDAPPSYWTMDLFQDDLDRIADNLLSAVDLVPALGEVGFASVVNGPTIWCPDGLARVGRSSVPGYYDFNTQTYGIAQSLPLAEFLAGIIVNDEEPWHMPDLCPLRFGGAEPWASPGYVAAKVKETYSHNNRVAYPFENRQAGRALLQGSSAPLVEAFKEDGAVCGLAGGGETPLFFAPNGHPSRLEGDTCRHFSNLPWAAVAEAEAAAVLHGVGVSHAAFSKLLVRGVGADEFLDALTTNVLPKEGRCRLTYALTPSGRIWSEFTVSRLEEGLYLVGNRDAGAADHARLAAMAPAGVTVVDLSAEVEILHFAGPQAPDLLARLAGDGADAIPYLGVGELRLAVGDGGDEVLARCFKVSFSGLPGFELHCSASDAHRIYTHVRAHHAHVVPFGAYALNGLRVEKGFKVRGDLDYAHYSEAGIEPFVSADKLERRAFRGAGTAAPTSAPRQAVLWGVNTPATHAWTVPSDTPIRRTADDAVVGFTTSSARGAVTGRTVALGYRSGPGLAPDFMDKATPLYLESYGHRWEVETLAGPLVVPQRWPKKPAPAKAALNVQPAAAATTTTAPAA